MGHAGVGRGDPQFVTVTPFSAALSHVFSANLSWAEKGHAPLVSTDHVFNHTIRFRTLVDKSPFVMMRHLFKLSLSEEFKDRLTMIDLPLSFEALVELAIMVYNWL